jgi:D-sedoheptulose 7-phosphate isomerase
LEVTNFGLMKFRISHHKGKMIKEFFVNQSNELADRLKRHDWSSAVQLHEAMAKAWSEKKQVFICGNGGSGGNACHWANDFLYPVTKKIGSGLRIRSLVSNPAVLTCLANDEGYDQIFSSQLKIFAEKGDILIAFSGSGNSPNILRALETAKELGVKSFAVVSFTGGKCLELADVPIYFQVKDMQLAEDFQSVLGHLLMRSLQAEHAKQQ